MISLIHVWGQIILMMMTIIVIEAFLENVFRKLKQYLSGELRSLTAKYLPPSIMPPLSRDRTRKFKLNILPCFDQQATSFRSKYTIKIQGFWSINSLLLALGFLKRDK
jgi:hypothetical protein